jgi:hypothetical protein
MRCRRAGTSLMTEPITKKRPNRGNLSGPGVGTWIILCPVELSVYNLWSFCRLFHPAHVPNTQLASLIVKELIRLALALSTTVSCSGAQLIDASCVQT